MFYTVFLSSLCRFDEHFIHIKRKQDYWCLLLQYRSNKKLTFSVKAFKLGEDCKNDNCE